MRSTWLFGVALLMTLAGCGDVGAIEKKKTDSRTFPLSGNTLTIDNSNADLRLVAGDELTVERSLTGKAATEDNASWELTGTTLRLKITCSGLVINCGGRHVVAVPANVAVTVTSNSPVRAVGLPNSLAATVHGSWLRVENPGGVLRLTNSGGTLVVTGARSTDVQATSDENISLAFSAAPGIVSARSTHGATDIVVPAGTETYRVALDGTASTSIPNDPGSSRTLTASGTTVSIRKAGQ